MSRSGTSRWSWSDKLAIALACLATAMALALSWMDRTPTWAAVTISCMGALVFYPVMHFIRSWKARVPFLLVVWGCIGLFGWKIWPHCIPQQSPVVVTPPPVPERPTINQSAFDSECANFFVAGSDAQINCVAKDKGRNDKDKPHH
jgi:hypothetical protein